MLKNILLWRYGRTTWQYDVLCVLILAFVFLTPKSWFQGSEPRGSAAHPNPLKSVTIFVPPGSPADRNDLERRVRSLPGRHDSRIRNMRPMADAEGRTIAYEVDLE